MIKRLSDIGCVFTIHLARLRREAGPFLLAAIVFPIGMYFFASGIAYRNSADAVPDDAKAHFLAASIVFSLSLTAISWLGYLLLENRFMGRLKLFSTLPLTVSSYVFGVLVFALLQGIFSTIVMLGAAGLLGVPININVTGALSLSAVVAAAILVLGGVSVIIAARARSFSEGSLLTDALGAGMVLLAPVYYPAEALPSLLQWLARILPTTYAAQAVNKILTGNSSVGFEILVLVLMAGITLRGGFYLMTWREE